MRKKTQLFTHPLYTVKVYRLRNQVSQKMRKTDVTRAWTEFQRFFSPRNPEGENDYPNSAEISDSPGGHMHSPSSG